MTKAYFYAMVESRGKGLKCKVICDYKIFSPCPGNCPIREERREDKNDEVKQKRFYLS